MAPRPYWKGYLKLSLVSCPIALSPAISSSEKISFRQVNKGTGNRIRYKKVDAETGQEVASDQIGKGFEVAKGEYLFLNSTGLQADYPFCTPLEISISDQFIVAKMFPSSALDYLAVEVRTGRSAGFRPPHARATQRRKF